VPGEREPRRKVDSFDERGKGLLRSGLALGDRERKNRPFEIAGKGEINTTNTTNTTNSTNKAKINPDSLLFCGTYGKSKLKVKSDKVKIPYLDLGFIIYAGLAANYKKGKKSGFLLK
jgi:hypothetical protein